MASDVYKPPHMPWFERDFWSFRVRHLPSLARLMYRSLLQQGWHSARPPYLPGDDDTLMKMADAPSREDWERHRDAVLGMFEQTEDGRWCFHPKSLELMAKVTADHEAKSRGGQTVSRNRSAKAEQKLSNSSAKGQLKPSSSSANSDLLLSSRNQNHNQIQIQSQNPREPQPEPITDAHLRTPPVEDGDSTKLSHFVSLYNDNCGKLFPTIRGLTRERVRKLNARLNANRNFQGDFVASVKKAANTPFLTGQNERGWKCSFDWLIENDTNCVAVLEGKYDGARSGGKLKGGGFHDNGDQSRYTKDADLVCDNTEL